MLVQYYYWRHEGYGADVGGFLPNSLS